LSIFDSSQVENALDYKKTIKDRDKETEQRLYLKEGVCAEFGEIVGESPALRTALSLVSPHAEEVRLGKPKQRSPQNSNHFYYGTG
jgi:hypothetical protein